MSTPYQTPLTILLLFAAATGIVLLVRLVTRRLLGTMEAVSHDHRLELKRRARRLVGLIAFLSFALASAASISVAMSGSGGWSLRTLGDWFSTHGANIVAILLGAVIVLRVANLAIEQFQHRLTAEDARSDLEQLRRASTVRGLLSNLVATAVSFVAALMILRELSIDVVPLLTGAGIAGLAIGFGAQNFVRDVISGFFIISEDQVRVGDLARINNVTGTVELIKLRTIVVRDDQGAVQVFQNGGITSLANLSKQFAYAVVDVRVPYTERIDRVIGTVGEVGAQMGREPPWSALVLAPLEIVGVESIADGAATVRVKFKTRPLVQGSVAAELRKRVLDAFVERGIQLFTPERKGR